MIKVCFSAINSGNHGSPGDLMERKYDDAKSISHLPAVGDNVMIQWGDDIAQSSTFKVEKIDKQFWQDYDHVHIWVANIE